MFKIKNILNFEIVGTVFIIFLGSLLHFTYALSGDRSVVGFFSAVNESVWEHLKLAFWPSLLWMLVGFVPLKKSVNNFFAAKAAGTYIMVAIIPLVFYSYTAFTGESIFPIDIATFILAVILGQFVSYKLLGYRKLSKSVDRIAAAVVILLAIVFIAFTFYPPHLPIFQDPITGKYGISF